MQSSTDACVLDIKARSGQTDNLMTWSSDVGIADLGYMLPDGALVINDNVYIQANTFLITDNGGAVGKVSLKAGPGSSSYTATFPGITGTVMLLGGTQTVSGTKTITSLSTSVRTDTASSGFSLSDQSLVTRRLRFVLSGAVGDNSFTFESTAARDYKYTDQSGAVATDANIVCVDDTVVCSDNAVVLYY
jgi:hypothetical protein